MLFLRATKVANYLLSNFLSFFILSYKVLNYLNAMGDAFQRNCDLIRKLTRNSAFYIHLVFVLSFFKNFGKPDFVTISNGITNFPDDFITVNELIFCLNQFSGFYGFCSGFPENFFTNKIEVEGGGK